ncbi:unnamed protein product [Ectocarpus sp. 13 AM-2016]
MKSFRAWRQESQWQLDDDGGECDVPAGGSSGRVSREAGGGGMRRGDTLRSITMPTSDDRELSGGRVVNEEAIYNMRKRWISDRLMEREGNFCRYPSVTVFCGTYNVAGKKSEGEDLGPWLKQCTGEPDIYALGFQEIVDLNAVNVAVSDSKSQQRAAIWRQELEKFLSTKRSRYTLIEHRSLVGIVLFVYVRANHIQDGAVKDVQATTARVGMMGVMGNKGAVVVRLSLYDSTLCFVCAHMAAKRANVLGRNADFWSILNKTAFVGDPETAWEFRDLPCEFSRGRVEGGVGILDHDIVFWLGDLNYRVSETVHLDEVFRRCRSKEGKVFLQAHDQLNLERARGPRAAFGEFEEAPITFPPTYKYQPGTQLYEERPDKKRRAPAWCDRVLWRTRDVGHVTSVRYARGDLVLSDHKPVCAELSVKIRLIERAEHRRNFEDITTQIRRVESQGSAPEITLGSSALDLGDVYFRTMASVVLRVANVGQGLAFLRFTSKLGELVPFRRWLRVEPPFALLAPGERTEFRVSVFIDRLTARELCAGFEVLEELLVLRLEGGAEHYVPVRGRYASRAFGTPLEQLSARHGSQAARLGIPVELWRLVDSVIGSGALQTAEGAAELFPPVETAMPPDVPLDDQTAAVLRCLDAGSEFPPSIERPALVSAILAFLSSLPEPVVPVAAVKAVESELSAHRVSGASGQGAGGTAGGAWGETFLRALSPSQNNTFLYVASFLREVARAGRSAGLRSGPLACFACDSLCFPDPPWLGSVASSSSTIVGASDRSSDTSVPWQEHREVFRVLLSSFVSATR